MKNTQQTPPFNIDQQIDLLEYLHALLRHKYAIFIAATLAAMLVFSLTLLMDNKYTAHSLVAININEEPGSVKPDERQSNYTLGLLENDFILDSSQSRSNESKRMMATLNSYSFNVKFIEEQNLLPYIFQDDWDPINETWIDGFQPDMRRANEAFITMRSYELNDDTGLLWIFFTTKDPEFSAKLANAIIPSFNNFTKQKQVKLIEERQAYLNKRLQEIDNIQLHRSIYRMIESQIGAESLIFARKDYPLEVIQPALPPLHKSSPKRKQYAALSFIGFLVLGMMIAMGSVLLKKIKQGLSEYQTTIADDIQPQIEIANTDGEAGIEPADEWIDK